MLINDEDTIAADEIALMTQLESRMSDVAGCATGVRAWCAISGWLAVCCWS